MDYSVILSILAIVVAAGACLLESFYSHKANKFERYNRFLEFWLEMDSLFIEHPELHPYFYGSAKDRLPEDEAELELGLCIAERFRDVFQYSETIAKSIDRKYVESYQDYMDRIMATALYREADRRNPIVYTQKHPIGAAIK